MGACFSKKDSQIQHTHGNSDEERLSPLPKHKLIGRDVSSIKVQEPLNVNLSELPRPESIDVSYYDPIESTRQLDEYINLKLADTDTQLLSINSTPAIELRDSIVKEHMTVISGFQILEEWRPAASRDLV